MTPATKPKLKKAETSFLGGLFGKKKAPMQKSPTLFSEAREDDDDTMPSFYGNSEDEGDSFNSSYYEEGGVKGSKKKEEKERHKLEILRYLTWMEYGVIAVELFLIIYTILVLLGIVPIF